MRTLSEAKRWRSLGVACIPIRARSKAPAIDSWRPFQKRLPTLRQLEVWFGSGRYSIAAITGHRGLVVIDFDDEWRYSQWLATLESNVAALVLGTYRVRTRRGWHFYFYSREPAECWAGGRVDVKAAGGYVLAPPSVHPSGHRYEPLGTPSQIATIGRVGELLPEYEARESWQTDGGRALSHERDPFDLAMKDSEPTGTTIEEIKGRWSFEDLLDGDGRRGRVWHARCPFHDDNHASMAIYPDGHAFCFGCRWSGDVIDAYAALHGLSLADAMREMS